MAFPEDFTADLNNGRLFFAQSGKGPAILDDVNDGLLQALLPCFGFMGGPLKLLIHLAGRHQDGQFRESSAEVGFKP